jgi:hypothetical protein
VIIVNYRRWGETAALVQQLAGTDHLYRGRVELLIVDNDSPPDPVETTIKLRYGVAVHRLPRNVGFSAGVNAGVARSRGRWVLVLNPDLVVCEGFLDLIVAAALEADKGDDDGEPVGVLGFQLRNRDGSRQYSTGLFPTLGRMVLGLLRPRSCRKYELLDTRERRRVPWVTGCCLLIRRTCLKRLHGFDEEYFLYYEDVDLCRRAQERGYAVCYEPAIQAVHLDPLQNRPLTETMRAVTRHASLTYFRKHRPGWQLWGLAQLIRIEAAVREAVAMCRRRRDDAATCRQLRGICRDLVRRRPEAARARLEEVLRRAGMCP